MSITAWDLDAVILSIRRERDTLNAEDDGDPTTATGVVREARSGAQSHLQAVLHRDDLSPETRALVQQAYDYLCGPDQDKTDPATFSYAKRLHMAVQQFGSHAEQSVNRLRGKL